MSLKSVLLKIFGWWDGATIGTAVHTRLYGVRVGEDPAGNVFYQTRDGKRRWVIYNGMAETSRIEPEWQGWMHHTWDEPPTVRPMNHKSWERPSVPNLSGTDLAWVPPGSIRRADPVERRDYDAWTPE